ncbi:MAG TPA: hypothetical protein PK020_07020 [Ilumatobacteraceae bacterium]|nr:hypothetical protein [Ilumatobacteraceae bacterium]HRB04082.1 hypothetical protein [Ilumatobacteraceae bacterium]
MAGSGILLKVGLPLLLVGGGVAAYLTAPSSVASARADVWIDSPDDGVLISAGPAFVVAHATAESGVSSLSLEVDGTIVSSSSDLEAFDTLVAATLPWDATDGPHQLVVTGDGQRSAPVMVQVGVAAEVPSASLPTRLTLPPSGTSTTSVSTTTTVSETTTTVEATTTVPPTAPPTVPPATNPPPTNPPPTNPPATNPPATNPPATNPPATNPPAPTIGNVTLAPASGTSLRCTGDQVRVTASVSNATSGQMKIYFTVSNGLFETVNGSVSGGVFTATRDGATPVKIPTAQYYVTITVTGPGGSTDTNAGQFSSDCTKD